MPIIERTDCADLIDYVLSLVGEALPEDCAVSRGSVQSFLDDTRAPVQYERLESRYQIVPGGQIVYKQFSDEDGGFLDYSAQVLDAGYNPIDRADADVWDALRGRWTFKNSKGSVLYLFGDRYDVNLAAANLLRKLQADNKYSVDTADQSIKTFDSQALATMARLEASYRASARIVVFEFSRSDV